MTIDKSETWWKGDDLHDLLLYIKDFTQDEFPAERFGKCVCTCGGSSFTFVGSPERGIAERTCTACEKPHYVCDSEKHWDQEVLEAFACPCEAEVFELAVGFSMRADSLPDDVQWITLAGRCLECGILAVYADWRVNDSPSAHLLKQA